jgi:hypothetical protein
MYVISPNRDEGWVVSEAAALLRFGVFEDGRHSSMAGSSLIHWGQRSPLGKVATLCAETIAHEMWAHAILTGK